MPAPRAVPTDLHGLLNEALALYHGLLSEVHSSADFERSAAECARGPRAIAAASSSISIDNAIEAMDRRGAIAIETHHDPAHRLVRLIVADNGPGIPEAEREKLFLPYYSTKGRGSGLGLAIVRRIVAEHGGIDRGRR